MSAFTLSQGRKMVYPRISSREHRESNERPGTGSPPARTTRSLRNMN